MEFKLKFHEYVVLFLAFFAGVIFLILGITAVILAFSFPNVYSLKELFTETNFIPNHFIPFIILGLFFLIIGTYYAKYLFNIFSCNCKSIIVDMDNQQLILNLKKYGTIKLPFEEIAEIKMKYKAIIRSLEFGFLKIYISNGDVYTFATSYAKYLHKVLYSIKKH